MCGVNIHHWIAGKRLGVRMPGGGYPGPLRREGVAAPRPYAHPTSYTSTVILNAYSADLKADTLVDC